MFYKLKNHEFKYEVQSISQVFYPNEKFVIVDFPVNNGITLESELTKTSLNCKIYTDGQLTLNYNCKIEEDTEKEKKHLIKLSIFNALKQLTGLNPPWGILTGIRPAKIVHELWNKDYDDMGVIKFAENYYKVSKDKLDLCVEVAHQESSILKNNDGTNISLYVGIPFCTSRCLYCSFTSYSLEKYEQWVDQYLNVLVKEMEYIKPYVSTKRLETIYIGGGTPTALNEKRLYFLLDNIKKIFNMSQLKEFTVEAGRPDTITLEKLKIMKDFNVSRLSINPQTMNDKTLISIGRNHTTGDFLKSFQLAREIGHSNINVDLILGLPNETLKDCISTLEKIGSLQPENITIHTLSVKRASTLKESLNNYEFIETNILMEMLDFTRKYTKTLNMSPYYMYRQKNMLGNFENVGYCKEFYKCIYNVQIMEERQDILAVGAGAISKLVDIKTNRIERIFNVKNVEHYINRFDEMIERKKLLFRSR